MDINGGCHCGKIAYTAEVDPQHVVVCHCTDCQILSGTAYRTVVVAKANQFRLTGETKTYVKIADSGRQRAQVFCPECGTHIYATSLGDPSLYGIRAGTAAQRSELVPKRQIWCRSELPWLKDLATLPQSSVG